VGRSKLKRQRCVSRDAQGAKRGGVRGGGVPLRGGGVPAGEGSEEGAILSPQKFLYRPKAIHCNYQLSIIAVFVEYIRQFLIDLNQIYRHSSVPQNTSP